MISAKGSVDFAMWAAARRRRALVWDNSPAGMSWQCHSGAALTPEALCDGADYYLTKPFDNMELLPRVNPGKSGLHPKWDAARLKMRNGITGFPALHGPCRTGSCGTRYRYGSGCTASLCMLTCLVIYALFIFGKACNCWTAFGSGFALISEWSHY